MTRYVAFLRAVNVTASRRVGMARVRGVLEELGLTDVESFANSGNLAFSGAGRSADYERRIRAALEDEFAKELTTFVRTAAQVRQIVDTEPFGEIRTGHTYFVLLPFRRLTAAQQRTVEAMSNDFDEVLVRGRDVHWLMRGKSTATTLGPRAWTDALPGMATTARNMTLVRRLVDRL